MPGVRLGGEQRVVLVPLELARVQPEYCLVQTEPPLSPGSWAEGSEECMQLAQGPWQPISCPTNLLSSLEDERSTYLHDTVE